MIHPISFKSYNNRDIIQGWIYEPDSQWNYSGTTSYGPCGIVQIVHGFSEHSGRFEHVINAFLKAGFIVVADDHVGHGRTAEANNTWGDWGSAGPHTMMEDEYTLMRITKDRYQRTYPNLPYFMFGYSMGSLIARDFATKYGNELKGVIISGTMAHVRGAKEALELIDRDMAMGKGDQCNMDYVRMIFGWMTEFCEEEIEYTIEWVCHDKEVVRNMYYDPLCTVAKPIKIKSIGDFARMIEQVAGTEWASKVPVNLPFYNMAGDDDPVGNYGQGAFQVTNWLLETGHNVKTDLYRGYRHELHSYKDIRDEVEAKMIEFMNSCM